MEGNKTFLVLIFLIALVVAFTLTSFMAQIFSPESAGEQASEQVGKSDTEEENLNLEIENKMNEASTPPENFSAVTTVQFENVAVTVTIADTQDERAKGLSGLKSLGTREGMLFIFPKSDFHGFWMKDMLFSIDIIWLGADFKIKSIAKGVKPESFPKIFRPEKESRFVLEVNAGFADEYGLKIGDRANFIKK